MLANNADLQHRLEEVISENVPGSLGDTLSQAVQSVIDNRGSIGVIALLGVAYAGLGWVGNLRTGVQLVWAGEVRRRTSSRPSSRTCSCSSASASGSCSRWRSPPA